MKAVFMLFFRMSVVLGLAYEWLFKGIAGAGNVLSAYVFLFALLSVVVASIPVSPKSLKFKFIGKFWRSIEVLFQVAMFCTFVWFGHFGIAFFWMVMCVSIAILRIRVLDFQSKAKKMGFTADDAGALGEILDAAINGKKTERNAARNKPSDGGIGQYAKP